MKLLKINKLKSLILSGVLSFSLLVTGCSTSKQITTIDTPSVTKNESITAPNKNDNNETSTPEESKNNITTQDTTNNEVPQGSVEAIVERVVDGDTMKLKIKDTGKVVTLRLLLVDTPESVKQGVDPQPYSIEASNFAKETLKVGDTIYIEYDEGSKTDKYDRHLGYLWFYCKEDSNWEIFNEKIIAKGYARVGYVYDQKRHLDRFCNAQDSAKSNKLNIWSVPGYVTNKGYDVDAYNKNTSSTTSSTSSDIESSSPDSSSNMVYANGGSSSSNKYHSTPSAHNMKGSIEMTEAEAKSSGYVPCGLCY